MAKSKSCKTSLSNLKGKKPYMTSSCHISALDDDKNRPRMWAYQNISMVEALTKFSTFFKSDKIITFSHLNSTTFNDKSKDNFLREKIIKWPQKVKL